MEHTTGSDLEGAIQKWREELAPLGVLTEEELKELEFHLRDATQLLVARGVPLQEALWVARKRLGSGELLVREYEKVPGGEGSVRPSRRRLISIERNIILPAKAFAIALGAVSFLWKPWYALTLGTYEVWLSTFLGIGLIFVALELIWAFGLLLQARLPARMLSLALFGIWLADLSLVTLFSLVTSETEITFLLLIALIVRAAAVGGSPARQALFTLALLACYGLSYVWNFEVMGPGAASDLGNFVARGIVLGIAGLTATVLPYLEARRSPGRGAISWGK